MGKGNASFRRTLKLGAIINSFPETQGKSYPECDDGQKARMLLENAFKVITGETYTNMWWEENKKYI